MLLLLLFLWLLGRRGEGKFVVVRGVLLLLFLGGCCCCFGGHTIACLHVCFCFFSGVVCLFVCICCCFVCLLLSCCLVYTIIKQKGNTGTERKWP